MSDENREKQEKTFDFHLMEVENDMNFVPYTKKPVSQPKLS